VAIFRGPTVYRQPARPSDRAVHAQTNVWGDRLVTILRNQDKFFGLAGHPTFDWPVPNGRPYPVALRSYSVGNLLETTLAPNDRPFAQSDWPVPKGRANPASNLTHTEAVKLLLASKDVIYAASGEAPAYDWQVPKGRTGSVSLRQWDNTLAGTQLYFVQPPFRQTNWPVPKGRTPPTSLREEHHVFLVRPDFLPFRQTDWPVPKGRKSSIVLQTWTEQYKLELLNKDQFFGAAGEPAPHTDWPVPKGRTPSVSLRTWTDSLKLNLSGKDTFYAAPGLSPGQHDWPVPKGRRGSVGLGTWTVGLNLNLPVPFFVLAQPFNQHDYPVPRGRQPTISLKTHIQTTNVLRSLDTFYGAPGQAPEQRDWPVPRGRQPSIALKTHTNTNVRYLGQDRFYAGIGVGPDFDYPNPRGRQPARELRTFVHRTDTQLIGQDKFFAAAGEAPHYEYPNPRGRRSPVSILLVESGYHGTALLPVEYPELVVMAQGYYAPVVVQGWQIMDAQGDYDEQQVLGWFPPGDAP
jgi:hypothetical protein